jgi:formylglycine-generating enzyme required for sulfatase activity/predicted Ser/Thr protein kinase
MDGRRAEDTSSFEAAELSGLVAACERFEARWRAGGDPRIEDFLEGVAPPIRPRLLRELLAIEIELRAARGESPAPADYLERHPDWSAAVADVFSRETFESRRTEHPSQPTAVPTGPDDPADSDDSGASGIDIDDTVEYIRVVPPSMRPAEPLPERFGRYPVLSLLGHGGFGSVYLARDEELGRPVAIKVPHRGVLRGPAQVESFRAEARNAARLVHPNIVRVYDVGNHGEGEPFVVFEYIDGRDLAKILKSQRPSPATVAGLMARVAEAAHHAHSAGLVHRDLKPSNILVDRRGIPHVADFGLALREDAQQLMTGEVAGTPAFMAPEQVRGETHRLDRRTDVWALGVILYQALTGRRPFRGKNRARTFKRVLGLDPTPLRQLDGAIPRELERICLKCLAKRMTDRYETAAELADDLDRWLALEGAAAVVAGATGVGFVASPPWRTAPVPPPAPIVSKGLRAFDPEDAAFFPRLVPGPRDRDGLPESIRRWLRRIEEADAARSFAVGLIYGPSGGGKSSFVKAGLIPRLARWVHPVYVEAAAEGTEARLLAALGREFPGLPAGCGLPEAAAALREGRAARGGSKALVVLDQFEHWLHGHPEADDGDLVRALRQCDGAGLQALLLVRDDFWMAITRFLRVLEVRPIEGDNASAVEPFDARHAGSVLAELGRGLGRLHDPAGPDEARFLERAVKNLAGPDGRVIPVRLTLLAEMLRHRDWTPATLRELGGFEGIGVTFLEETFSAPTAPLAHRMHQDAARAVLKALLPEPSSDLKGRMRSASALRQAAGYVDRPADFTELMALLDNELRMVTPVDSSAVELDPPGAEPGPAGAAPTTAAPSGETSSDETPSDETPSGETSDETPHSPVTSSMSAVEAAEGMGISPVEGPQTGRERVPEGIPETYYQLTHDYLVPPVRQWLTRKQRETLRGRAELRLATITALWRERPERRRLPSLVEWLMIVGLTRPGGRSLDERRMMRAATRHHLSRAAAALLIAVGLAWSFVAYRDRERADALLARMLDAGYQDLPGLLPEWEAARDVHRPTLLALEKDPLARPHHRDVVEILLYRDRPTADRGAALGRRLTAAQAQPEEVSAIRGALAAHPDQAGVDAFRRLLRDDAAQPAARLRAGCALQGLEVGFAGSPDAKAGAPVMAEALLAEDRRAFPRWLELLGPAAADLVPTLAAISGDPGRESYAQTAAAEAQLAYVLGRGGSDLELARVVAEGTPLVSGVILREFGGGKPSREVKDFFQAILRERVGDPYDEDRKDDLAARQAAAATALAVLGEPERLWPLLLHGDDPRLRSLLIQRLAAGAVPADILNERLRQDLDPIECQALLLAWAEARLAAVPAAKRAEVVERARHLYLHHPHPGVHSAAELLLRRWGDAEFLAQAVGRPSEPHVGPDGLGWERGPNGQTFAILPASMMVYRMGSPEQEKGRYGDQVLHIRAIGRSLAVSMTEVTFEQIRALDKDHSQATRHGAQTSCAANNVDWFRAVRYCNALSREAKLSPYQWCYPERTDPDQIIPADAVDKPGFRLPTEAEWECICRAGTETARYFGESDRLLSRYAWTWLNSDDRVHPAGQLLPNEYGMFDMLGNVWEWTHDGPAGAYPDVPLPAYPHGTRERPAPDPGRPEVVLGAGRRQETWRILRGGAFNYSPIKARSAHRDWIGALSPCSYIGFRVVRTLPSQPGGAAPPEVAARRLDATASARPPGSGEEDD